MTKIIKSPGTEILHIKVMLPFWDEAINGIDEESPYRVIAVRPDIGLHELGLYVLKAFNFDHDHLFGFYNNLKAYYDSKISYEFPIMMQDNDDSWSSFETSTGKVTYNLEKHTARDIFTRKGKKWLMLFDYGDNWQFWLTLEKKVPIETKKQYPEIIESKYDAPEQYPEYDDED